MTFVIEYISHDGNREWTTYDADSFDAAMEWASNDDDNVDDNICDILDIYEGTEMR